MNQSELYDALVSLDEKYTEEAEAFLFAEKESFTTNAQCKKIRTSRLTGVAASVIAMVCIMAIVMSLSYYNSGNGLKNNFGPIVSSSNDIQQSTLVSTEMCAVSSLSDSLSKPRVDGYYVWMSGPACVEINSAFFIECAFGERNNSPSYGLTDEEIALLDKEYREQGPSAMGRYWRITNYTYESDESNFLYTKKQNDFISFFGESDYKEDISLERMKKEFVFDDSRFRNEPDPSLLPYHVKVPVQISQIDNGTKGKIVATFGWRAPDNQQAGNAASFCYYVNNSFIGFGSTEEEAYNNSFVLMSEGLDIGAFDENTQRRQTIAENGIDEQIICQCTDSLRLRPIGLDNNNCFTKDKRISVSFELVGAKSDCDYCLKFKSDNIRSPEYTYYMENGHRFYDISFYASPDVNGSLNVTVLQNKNGVLSSVFQKDLTVYTANSQSNTYVSTASMETAMELAGQRVGDGLVCDNCSVIYTNASSRPASISVSGTVRWTDNAGNIHPASGLKVDIYKDASGGGNRSITTVTTNVNGQYTALLTATPGEYYDIYSRINVKGSNVSLVKPSSIPYYCTVDIAFNVVGGAAITNTHTFNNSSDVGRAVSIQQGLAVASNYIKSLEGSYYSNINVVFPSSGYYGTCYYDGQIYILSSDAFDWDVVEHEYGHYVEDVIGLTLPGGTHPYYENLEDIGLYTKDYATSLAWTEGWATYFAINLQKEMGAASLLIPYVGDMSYTDIEPISITFSLETPYQDYLLGEGNEVSISAALYDLTDPVNVLDYDNINCSSSTIWSIVKNNQSNRFSEFVTAFYNSTYDMSDKLKFGSTLTHFKMAALLNAPIGVTTSNPYFYWTPQGGSSYFPNNRFNLCFYDSPFNMVLCINGITSDHITLTANQWNSVKQQCGATIYCCVETYQSSPTQTGPYHSNLISINNPN